MSYMKKKHSTKKLNYCIEKFNLLPFEKWLQIFCLITKYILIFVYNECVYLTDDKKLHLFKWVQWNAW